MTDEADVPVPGAAPSLAALQARSASADPAPASLVAAADPVVARRFRHALAQQQLHPLMPLVLQHRRQGGQS